MSNLHRARRWLPIAAVAATVALLASCEFFFPEQLSRSQRISAFIDNLNTSSRTATFEHFHPNAGNYNQIKPADFWEGSVLSTANNPFSWTAGGAETDNGDGTFDVSGTLGHASNDFAATFTLKEEGQNDEIDNWLISKLLVTGGGIDIQRFP